MLDPTVTPGQRQCYGYDTRNRLTSAYTTTNAACGTATVTGPSPYNLTFGYNNIGNITSNTGSGTATPAPATYTYAAPSVACNGANVTKPHAVTATSGNGGSYGYDCNGSMTTRTMNGVAQTLAYDGYNRLKTVTASGQSTGFVYNADGQRIIRTNADGTKNLYLPDIELKTALPLLPAHRASTSGNNAAGAVTVTVTKPVVAVAGDVLVASVAAADGPVIPVTTLSTKTYEKDVWTGYTRTTTAQAHTGSNALSVNVYNTESNVSFTVGTANTFKGWLKGTGTITPSVRYFSSTWSLLGSATVTNLTLSPTAWTQWTATYTPPTGTAFVKVFLGGATNPYFLDDVVVTSGATTLSTTGFEADVWIGTTYTTSAQFHAGANSLIAVANAAGSSVGSNVSFTAGVPNTLSGWMKGNGTVIPRVMFFSPTWSWLGSATVPSKVLSATAWQQWSTTYTPPPGTGFVQVWMDNTDVADWYLDDVTVVAGGTGTLTAITPPAGWTPATKSGVAGEQLTTWTHAVAAGDPASWSFGLSQSTKAVAAVSAYTSVDPLTPIDVSATGSNISGTSHIAPSVVTTAANDLAITVTSPIVVATMTPPAGSTERADQAGGTGVRSLSVETSDFPRAAAGAIGTKVTVSTTAAISATATLALRQLAVPGPTTYTRYYTFAGETMALRQGTSGGGSDTLQWMFGNHQASTSVTTVAGSTTANRNRYLPYGGLRGNDAIATHRPGVPRPNRRRSDRAGLPQRKIPRPHLSPIHLSRPPRQHHTRRLRVCEQQPDRLLGPERA